MRSNKYGVDRRIVNDYETCRPSNFDGLVKSRRCHPEPVEG